MKAKVLILNPPSPDASYINRDLMGGMGVHNPSGKSLRAKIIFSIKSITIHIPFMQLVNAATILEMKGFDVKVIDAINTGKDLDYILKETKKFSPQFILIGVSSGCFIFERDEVARRLKNENPGTTVVAVGDMITEMPEMMLPWFDVAIMGEVENSIHLICDGNSYNKIPSIIWQEEGHIKYSEGEKHFISDLDKLPFPNWSLFPYKHYSYYPMLTVTPITLIQASRGCPYGCGYCPYPANQGRKWRARTAESVFNEIKYDVEKYGFKGFFFRDPLFTADQKRVDKLCDLIIKNKLKIQFVFETRPELLSMPGIIEKLKAAGCRTINFGIEDIHPEILKKINRVPLQLDKVSETIHKCEKAGIRTSCFFIIGLPGSTQKTIQENIEFSKKLFGSQTEYKIATPFPGTRLYKMAKEKGWIIQEGFDMLGGYSATMKISNELTLEYLEKIAEKSVVEYYFSPKYLLRYILRGDILSTANAFIKAKLLKH